MEREKALPESITSQAFADYCFTSNLRIEWIIPLAAAHDGNDASELLRDLVEERGNDDLDQIFPGIKTHIEALRKDEYWDRNLLETVLKWFAQQRMNGILVNVRRPVMNSASRYSWGHTWGKILYLPDISMLPEALKYFRKTFIDSTNAPGSRRVKNAERAKSKNQQTGRTQ